MVPAAFLVLTRSYTYAIGCSCFNRAAAGRRPKVELRFGLMPVHRRLTSRRSHYRDGRFKPTGSSVDLEEVELLGNALHLAERRGVGLAEHIQALAQTGADARDGGDQLHEVRNVLGQ